MPEMADKWIVVDPPQKESIFPHEWWNGRIWTLKRGELPWWPITRELVSVRASIRKAAEVRGYSLTTHKVDDSTIQFMAERYDLSRQLLFR